MCGRFFRYRKLDQLRDYFPIDVADFEVTPNYNVAPNHQVLSIIRHKNGKNHLVWFHWGLVPSWVEDKSIGCKMINVQSETVANKSRFRQAFKRRRCLTLADGFFEWKGNQPFLLTLPDKKPFGFAGIWETWEKGKQPYQTCSILTREASASVMPVHNRMPVILKSEAYDTWLDPENENPDLLQKILDSQIHTELVSFPVSKAVKNVKNNRPELIEPVNDLQ